MGPGEKVYSKGTYDLQHGIKARLCSWVERFVEALSPQPALCRNLRHALCTGYVTKRTNDLSGIAI